jgi:hypothetical protein
VSDVPVIDVPVIDVPVIDVPGWAKLFSRNGVE